MTPKLRAARPQDWPAIELLLRACELPIEGAKAHLDAFVVAEDETGVVAAAGIELYGKIGLLRSVAVRPDSRGKGLGTALVAWTLDYARRHGLSELDLLTTTAQDYFARFGFEHRDRTSAPEDLAASAEFCGACPASAVFMSKAVE